MLQKGYVTQSFHIWLFMLLRAHFLLSFHHLTRTFIPLLIKGIEFVDIALQTIYFHGTQRTYYTHAPFVL